MNSPTPEEVFAARTAIHATQAEAAALVHHSTVAWSQWEKPEGSPLRRRMHPSTWELFQIKAAAIRAKREAEPRVRPTKTNPP